MKKFKLIILLLVFTIILSLTKNTFAYGFGVKKTRDHSQPNVGIYQEIIESNNGFYVGDKDKKNIYLTFDCGYENGYTAKILDVLKEKNVKATFFVTGHYIDSASDLVLRMYNEGHVVANHSDKHRHINKITEEEIAKEINDLNAKYKALTNIDIAPFFRPPAGEFDDRSLKVVTKLGYTPLFWSIAYVDWNKEQNVNYVVDEINSSIHNGAIILLHAVSKTNANALERIISSLEEQGYIFDVPYSLLTNNE